jgi:phosphoglycerate dehydrogenase-like enzyme
MGKPGPLGPTLHEPTGLVAGPGLGTPSPRVLLVPGPTEFAAAAVRAGGGQLVGENDPIDALVWWDFELEGLADAVHAHPDVRWVQLPIAGVDELFEGGMFSGPHAAGIIWTCAKGSYARPVAEHALALALAGLRKLPERARARSWGIQEGTSLYDRPVTILGGGGITRELLGLLAPLRAHPTVVRRREGPVEGAERTVTTADLPSALAGSLVVFVALALSPETEHIIGEAELAAMGPDAWLVNVARGRHVDTPALVEALKEGRIGGAALDVTDPEPLPDGHPLWTMPNCLVTPHSADTPEMCRPLLAERIKENVERFAAGLPLVGTVDISAGY